MSYSHTGGFLWKRPLWALTGSMLLEMFVDERIEAFADSDHDDGENNGPDKPFCYNLLHGMILSRKI